ncbi:unnamed protein product [Ilex paraguariensis]|uniref:Cation/H+ exchanger domain-containing protein n=1 Tax=Ilex paraguariensis TaxID=185542 RepID=A0ABC8QZS0_9AQUA
MADERLPLDELLPDQPNRFCSRDFQIHSHGVWDQTEARGFLKFALPRLQLQLAIMFLLTQSLHTLLKHCYLPRIVSEILAGVILGPSILGSIPNFTETFFPVQGEAFLELLGKIGFMFFMFLIGVKMDASMVRKVGIKAWIIGAAAVVIPVCVGSGSLIRVLHTTNLHSYRWPAVKNVLAIQTLIPFPVIASLLIDLKIMNTELGRLALATTLISDFLSTICNAAIVIVFTMRPVFVWIIRRTPEGKPVKGTYIAFIALAVLVSAIMTDNVGFRYHIGPFILGLCVPDGPPLGSTLVERLESVISGLFAPVLLTFCGLKLNLYVLYDLDFVGYMSAVISICVVMKFMAIFLPALLGKVPLRDAAALSLIMSAQGIVELAIYLTFFVNQTIDEDTFSVVTLSVLIVAAITSVLVRLIYDYSRKYSGYQKINILHAPYDAELRILTCSHRQDDAFAAIKLLEASYPSRESPIAAYALNLVELVGRSSPLLINHELGQKSSTGGSRSQPMIEAFHQFEQQYAELVNVQVFTAISLPKFMHQDICSLAFSKMSSLIILPFHKKWNHQGKMVFDSNVLRTLNRQVLDLAPCSVGILIDRRKIRAESSTLPLQSVYQVAVVFLGGDDDREALAYGKRMAKSPAAHLTVIRLIAQDDMGEKQWDTVLDTELLKDIKLQSPFQRNVEYREEKVKDGPDTALIIHAMEEAFDLIVVGRRHREDSPLLSGLAEWNELPELGPVGDILASADIKKPVSVLVVQQQIMKNK